MTDISAGWGSPAGTRETAGVPWWIPLVLGLVSIGFGVAVLVWPGPSLGVLAVLVGCWLILSGVARIVGAFLPGGVAHRVLSAIVGVLLVVAGFACLVN